MRVIGVAFVVLLAGCPLGPPTYIVPLAELDAELQLGKDNRFSFNYDMLRLEEPTVGRDHCRILSPRNSIATLDGLRGELEPGGPETSASIGDCYAPAFSWTSLPARTGPSTIEISDGSATWTFVIWQPFEDRYISLVSHPDDKPLRPGDTVVLRVMPAGSSTISNPLVRVSLSGTELFRLTESDGLTRVGDELSFVMPMAAPAKSVLLQTSVDLEYKIDRCDAPRGCKSVYVVSDSDFVDIVAP